MLHAYARHTKKSDIPLRMEPSLLLQRNSKCKTFLLYTVSVDAPKVFEKDAERLLWLASPRSSNRNDTSTEAKPQRLEENDGK